jgi:predicted ArsR family transcriptional regulator
LDRAAERLAALSEPLRRELYRFARAAASPITRDDAARHAAISRKLAAFHLDRLVEAGLLQSGTASPAPGERRRRGRARKTYAPSPAVIDISIPVRHYDVLGELLVDAVESARRRDDPRRAAMRVAHERGLQLGREARSKSRRRGVALRAAFGVLERCGYEPVAVGTDRVVLRSCPFASLAQRAPDLVCGMNHALLDGVLEGVGARGSEAVLAPAPGRCCVELRATA